MSWVLIILAVVSATPNSTTTTAYFSTKDMCEAARNQVTSDVNRDGRVVSSGCYLNGGGAVK